MASCLNHCDLHLVERALNKKGLVGAIGVSQTKVSFSIMSHSVHLMFLGQDERMSNSCSDLDSLVREDVFKRSEGKELLSHVGGSLLVPVVSRCVNDTVLIDRNGVFRAAVQVAELQSSEFMRIHGFKEVVASVTSKGTVSALAPSVELAVFGDAS